MLFVVVNILVFGLASANPFFRNEGRIVGGNETTIEENPWQVPLQYRSSHICGGSIISERFVLTAAHCTRRAEIGDLSFRVGSTHESKDGQVIKVAKVIQNPNYKIFKLDYDFVLLELEKSLTYSDQIQPIQLPNEDIDIPDGTIVLVTGWGDTRQSEKSTDVLRAVKVPIVNQQNCNKQYRNQITDRMICAGFEKGGKDACQGDSGGPLSLLDNDGSRVLVGVVSWGDDCAQPYYPGVYARVSSVRSWIKNISGV